MGARGGLAPNEARISLAPVSIWEGDSGSLWGLDCRGRYWSLLQLSQRATLKAFGATSMVGMERRGWLGERCKVGSGGGKREQGRARLLPGDRGQLHLSLQWEKEEAGRREVRQGPAQPEAPVERPCGEVASGACCRVWMRLQGTSPTFLCFTSVSGSQKRTSGYKDEVRPFEERQVSPHAVIRSSPRYIFR